MNDTLKKQVFPLLDCRVNKSVNKLIMLDIGAYYRIKYSSFFPELMIKKAKKYGMSKKDKRDFQSILNIFFTVSSKLPGKGLRYLFKV